MVRFSWSIEGEQQFSRKLGDLKTDLTDFSTPLTKIADNLVKTFSTEVFSTTGGAVGEKWKPLSPLTLALKAERGFPSDILIATGAMQKSFESVVSSEQAVIGNVAPYFKYHQSNQPRRRLPRRVMMKLGHQQREMIQKELIKYITENK